MALAELAVVPFFANVLATNFNIQSFGPHHLDIAFFCIGAVN